MVAVGIMEKRSNAPFFYFIAFNFAMSKAFLVVIISASSGE